MHLDCRSFFPLPLWERVAPKATGEGSIAVLSESCEDVLQDDRRTLQDIIVPVARDLEALRDQDRVSRRVTFARCMLTAVDLNDEASLEANEIENKALKGNLTTKFELCKPSIAEQTPHRRFSVRGLAAHRLCEIADALRGCSMAWRLRHEPLTRRLTSFGATLSHKGRGKISATARATTFTPASASARRARPWNPCPAPAWASRDRPAAAPRLRPRSGRQCPADSAN